LAQVVGLCFVGRSWTEKQAMGEKEGGYGGNKFGEYAVGYDSSVVIGAVEIGGASD